MNILVINAGSSSVKYKLFNMQTEEELLKGNVDRIGADGGPKTHKEAIAQVIENLGDHKVDAVGHRVVHGGEYFSQSVKITEDVLNKIRDCIELAPIHNPANLMGIESAEALLPGVPQVAVFDTAFHQTMPKKAYLYPIPTKMYEDYKIRRYGMHGTSHKYISEQAAAMLDKPNSDTKIITCHLGGGSSITAVKGGESIDTTMGFTPLAGVMMGTRSGDIDPAIIPYLMDKTGMNAAEINNMLNKESGLLAISKISSDFRDVGQAYLSGNKDAELALYMFAYQVKKFIGAYMAVLNGVDAIVFAGGVGEYNASSRKRILENLDGLGIKFDAEKNKDIRGKQAEITAEGSSVRIFVIPTKEELLIARQTKEKVSEELSL